MRVLRRTGLAAVAALALAAAGFVAAPAYAASVSTTVDGTTYEADDDMVSTGAVVTGFDGSSTTVTIPDTVEIGGTEYDVTRIGSSAFTTTDPDDSNRIIRGDITTVVIGDNVTSIGLQAFIQNKIDSLTLGASLTSIAGSAFMGNALTQVTFPSTLRNINGAAFLANPSLTTVEFTGPAPTVTPADAGEYSRTFNPDVPGFMISFPEEYGADQVSDGFTTPEWMGYPAQANGEDVPDEDVNITKTVDASFVRVYDWELEKTGTVGEIVVGDDDASADIDFTVTATPNGYADRYYLLQGTITATNGTLEPQTIDVTDVPDVGTSASCDVYDSAYAPADGVELDASDSVTFNYLCSLDGIPANGTNTATVTWGDGQSSSVTEDVAFTQRDSSFDSITIGDDHANPDGGYTELGTATWNSDHLPFDFEYMLTAENLPLNECTSVTNTAIIFEMERTADTTDEVCPESAAVTPVSEPTPEPAVKPVAGDPGPAALARTGVDFGGGYVAIALFLMLAGGALVLARHRNRNRTKAAGTGQEH